MSTSSASDAATPPTPASPPAPDAAASKHFPNQIPFILGNETCERFGYYGMRSVLTTYLQTPVIAGVVAGGTVAVAGDQIWSGLNLNEATTTIIVHTFIFLSYGSGIIGAWIADRFWGRYKTILRISLLYCAGYGVLFLSDFSDALDYKKTCLGIGLLLIALGAGGIKPCVSSFMGDQFKPNQKRLIERAFSIFYWCINLGSFGAFLVIPFVRDRHGYGIAFAIPGILMAIATLIFWCGRKRYEHAPLATGPGFWQVLLFALSRKERTNGDTFWDAARRRFGEEKVTEVSETLRAVRLFLFIPPFWALYDQNSSTWVMQGHQMQRIDLGDLPLVGRIFVDADQMQAANPAFIMLLVPVFTMLLYPLLGKLATPFRRIGIGMFLAAFSFGLVGWLQMRIETGESLSILWQLGPYLLLTAGEVLVSVTGLELSYTMAPRTMKSTVGSFWLLTVCAGQAIVILVTKYCGNDAATNAAETIAKETTVSSGRFFLYAAMLAATALIFALYTRFSRQKD